MSSRPNFNKSCRMAMGLHTRLSPRHDCTQSRILTCPFHFGGQRGCGKEGLRREERGGGKGDSGKKRIGYDRKKKGGGFSEYAVWYMLRSHPFIFNDCRIIDAGMCRLFYLFILLLLFLLEHCFLSLTLI